MGGGLLRISTYGAQDVYLTGNPEITFFKAVYKRYTHFSMETLEQQFFGAVGFGKTDIASTISKNGDLVSSMILKVDLPELPSGVKYVDSLGHALIDRVRINIGGDPIDEHQGRWLDIWDELTQTEQHRAGYDEMVSKVHGTGGQDGASRSLYIPLQFWFNRHPGLALPLVALQYHDVKVIFSFKELGEITTGWGATTTPATTTAAQWLLDNPSKDLAANFFVDYVYLDTTERSGFAQRAHEYLIDQVQGGLDEDFMPIDVEQRIKLNFSHPVMELIWVIEDSSAENRMSFSFTDTNDIEREFISEAKLQINGHDQTAFLPAKFHRLVAPYKYHTRIPSKPVYVFSFSLRPEDTVQPMGTCNFSRIDNAYLILKASDEAVVEYGSGGSLESNKPKCYVYARSYNLFKVTGGRGSMQYSN